MGRKRGSSWFAVVRRAFCSPTTKRNRKRDETDKQKQDKKREVSKANANQAQTHHTQEKKIVHVNKEAILNKAAVVIQTAFRGYLARRALLAFKGIVKLQAFIRGSNVRKQARLTLRCMQALVRLQDQMCDQQTRLSHERCRKSMFAESNNLWDRYKLDIQQRKSTSAGRSSATDEWEIFPCLIEDDEAMFKSRNKASLKREKALAYALSQQLWRFDSDIKNRTEWLSRWMATKKQDLTERRDSIRNVQVETLVAAQLNKALVLQMRSASPRCLSEERRHSTTNTPSSVSKYSCNKSTSNDSGATTPHYMTSTESAKAKTRSANTPSQRPSTPGRERVRKRLSYPVAEQLGSDCADSGSFSQCLRSPSFRSALPYLEAYGNSCYDESACEKISPASTALPRRWLN